MFFKKYMVALKVLMKKPVMLWGLSLLLALLTFLGMYLTCSIPVVAIVVSYLFTLGGVKLYMDGLKGKEVNSKQLFAAFNKNWLKSAAAMGWQQLWTQIWGFVPVMGTIKRLSYRFVPYIISIHPEISAFDALKLSMRMTQGKRLQMWLADLVLAGAIVTTVAILAALAWVRYIGFFFLLALLSVLLVVALFGKIFVGLYQASFFSEEELEQYLAAPDVTVAE